MNEMKLTVPQEDAGKRIDSWLSEHIDGLTRSAVQNLLSEQAVWKSGQKKLQARRRRGSYRHYAGAA